MTSGSKALSSSFYVNPHYQQLEYQPKYCGLTDLEKFVQYNITEESIPNVEGAIQLIQTAEAEIDSKEWGRYTQTDEYLDGKYEILTFQWHYAGFFSQVFYPQHTNILRVIQCHYNTGGTPSANPIWTAVTEGPAANSNFVILRTARLKEQVGSALLFYSQVPYPGPLRLRLTYEYGMNIDKALLREYAGKTAAMAVLEERSAAENVNINLKDGPWAALYTKYADRVRYLREEVFPKKVRKVYVYPSAG